MNKKPLPHQSYLHLVKAGFAYRFVDQDELKALGKSAEVALCLELVRPDKMIEHFHRLFADRLDGDLLRLTDSDIQEIRINHGAQLVA